MTERNEILLPAFTLTFATDESILGWKKSSYLYLPNKTLKARFIFFTLCPHVEAAGCFNYNISINDEGWNPQQYFCGEIYSKGQPRQMWGFGSLSLAYSKIFFLLSLHGSSGMKTLSKDTLRGHMVLRRLLFKRYPLCVTVESSLGELWN